MEPEERGRYYNNLGMALFRLQRRHDALKSFRKAIIFAPEEPLFWSNLGAAYGSMGDYGNSVSILERGMAVVSDSNPLKKNLAVSYMKLGEFEKAAAILEGMPSQSKEEHEAISSLLSRAREGMFPHRSRVASDRAETRE